MRDKMKNLLTEYGAVAFVTYFGLFFLTLAGFVIAIKLGFHVESAGGTLGVLGAAYVAAKLTQPIRLAATVGLTPIVAKVYERLSGKSGKRDQSDQQDKSDEQA